MPSGNCGHDEQHGDLNPDQRLRMKAEACRKVVLDLEERGTSKTCSSCGQVNKGLVGSKVFKCRRCGHEEDRDVNAAKNLSLIHI